MIKLLVRTRIRLAALVFIGLSASCANFSANTSTNEQPPVDTTKPTTYQEYKAWRQQYDPEGSTYAEYKAWEEEYRRWQWEQQQKAP